MSARLSVYWLRLTEAALSRLHGTYRGPSGVTPAYSLLTRRGAITVHSQVNPIKPVLGTKEISLLKLPQEFSEYNFEWKVAKGYLDIKWTESGRLVPICCTPRRLPACTVSLPATPQNSAVEESMTAPSSIVTLLSLVSSGAGTAYGETEPTSQTVTVKVPT